MIEIVVDNLYSQVKDESLFKLIDAKLAVKAPGYQYSVAYKTHMWDGKIHFISPRGYFLTGLLEKVLSIVGNNTHITDKRVKPHNTPLLSRNSIKLRDYQTEAVAKMVSAGRGILKSATNSGKTIIGAELTKQLNLKTMWIVHRKELLYQTTNVLSDYLKMPIGKVGDGTVDIKQVTVVMPSSVVRNNKILPRYVSLKKSDVIIFDECHNIGDSRIKTLISQTPAYYRYAMSGTPLLNTEDKNTLLRGFFGEVIYSISNQDLIQMDVSSTPHVYFTKIENSYLEDAEYSVAYKLGVVVNEDRNNAIINSVKLLPNKSILIIVREIEHGKSLYEELQKTTSAYYISGNDSTEHRQMGIQMLKNREINVLISSTILDEGVDIPSIDVLILGAGQKTPKRFLQRVGRGLRKSQASNDLLVIDFLDVGNYYLIKHSQKRVQTCLDENFDVVFCASTKDLAEKLQCL